MPPASDTFLPASLPFDRSLLSPGARVAVAVSGGADSTALLRALAAANRAPRASLGIGLSAVHVHHGIRGALADRDQRFVQNLCQDLDLPLTIRAVDTPGHAATAHETLEEAARSLRYRFFSEHLGSGDSDIIATAHTADDQAETVLMKLLRGAWTEGLAGIFPSVEVRLPHRPPARIVRPLLSTSRDSIESFLRSIGQTWVEDETNADPAFTRNRLRRQLMPLLLSYNPSLLATLGNLAEIARDEEAFWQSELGRLLPQLVLPGKPVRGGGRANATAPDGNVLALEIERLRALAPALRRRVLRATARQLGMALSFSETARLLAFAGLSPEMATVPAKPGASLTLSSGLRAERSLRELRLARAPQPSAIP